MDIYPDHKGSAGTRPRVKQIRSFSVNFTIGPPPFRFLSFLRRALQLPFLFGKYQNIRRPRVFFLQDRSAIFLLSKKNYNKRSRKLFFFIFWRIGCGFPEEASECSDSSVIQKIVIAIVLRSPRLKNE